MDSYKKINKRKQYTLESLHHPLPHPVAISILWPLEIQVGKETLLMTNAYGLLNGGDCFYVGEWGSISSLATIPRLFSS
jgi:hypothetical protein